MVKSCSFLTLPLVGFSLSKRTIPLGSYFFAATTLFGKVKRELEAETAKKKAAQPGAAGRRRAALGYREHNNDQQRLCVRACCGERNKEAAGANRTFIRPRRCRRIAIRELAAWPAFHFRIFPEVCPDDSEGQV